jgi:hypothetical protein
VGVDYAKLDIKTLFQLVNEKNPQALAELLVRFEPLIKSKSKYHGHVDEDIAHCSFPSTYIHHAT